MVSEVGDHFNNFVVFALAMKKTHSGLVVTRIMLARAVPAVTIGPPQFRYRGGGRQFAAESEPLRRAERMEPRVSRGVQC